MHVSFLGVRRFVISGVVRVARHLPDEQRIDDGAVAEESAKVEI